MPDLMWLLPCTLVKGKIFEESYEFTYAKSEAFAVLFNFQGKDLEKKVILNIMKKLGISVFIRRILLRWGLFPISYYSWYEFKKLKNSQDLYRLCLEIDGTY